MKKILLLTLLIVGVLTFQSCSQDRYQDNIGIEESKKEELDLKLSFPDFNTGSSSCNSSILGYIEFSGNYTENEKNTLREKAASLNNFEICEVIASDCSDMELWKIKIDLSSLLLEFGKSKNDRINSIGNRDDDDDLDGEGSTEGGDIFSSLITNITHENLSLQIIKEIEDVTDPMCIEN
ncbi:hypothetical protein GCM10022393_04350 [Aquimarina addita]|uniref:Uncharacterized protein n=1 Tax=Aquimarina addita TaxID=870485 RepID=A0ABP7X9L1_9FLAO